MNIKVIESQIKIDEVKEIAKEFYYPMIKGTVDIDKEIIALGGEYHVDASTKLIERGSKPESIWGFNIYLDKEKNSPDWIEYVALINIKTNQNNRSMEIQNEEIRGKIREILEKLVI